MMGLTTPQKVSLATVASILIASGSFFMFSSPDTELDRVFFCGGNTGEIHYFPSGEWNDYGEKNGSGAFLPYKMLCPDVWYTMEEYERMFGYNESEAFTSGYIFVRMKDCDECRQDMPWTCTEECLGKLGNYSKNLTKFIPVLVNEKPVIINSTLVDEGLVG